MHIHDIKYLKKILSKYIPFHSKILDVGCGIGENLQLMQTLGYTSVYGVDVSELMVAISSKKGFNAVCVNNIAELPPSFDVLLFSHVLEHINFPEIQVFLENYFKLCNNNAHVIIIMPVLYDAFFNDIDHIKPYYPNGLMALFSDANISKQYLSNYMLTLVDIYYRNTNLLPYNIKCRFLNDKANHLKFILLNTLFDFLKKGTLGLLSKRTGYTAIFKLQTH